MMRHAPRLAGRGVAVLIALAIVAGALTRVLAWPAALAIVAAIFVVLLAIDAALVRTTPEIERLPIPRLALGRRAELTYEIVNRGASTLRIGLVEAPAARLAIDLPERALTLPPSARTRIAIGLVPRERGRTALHSYHARWSSLLGLIERRKAWNVPAALRVLPDLGALDRSGDLVARTKLLEAGTRRLRRRGDGGEFSSLREYGPDDAFRAIDWKASARRGRTMVIARESERGQQILLAIDAGRLMTPRLGDRRKLDYAVSAALGIASSARLASDRVGLHAFADVALASLAPGLGAAHSARMTDALSDLEPKFVESDYERTVLMLARSLRRRSLVVLFTDIVDPIASATVLAATRLLTPRHLVLVVLMNDAAIESALRIDPTTPTDAYRAAVAVALRDERARAVAGLRSRGVLVVDVPAAELTTALLDAYVNIKTRGLL
jgi:uncharacterized protein (DUF58 family)